MSTRCCKAKTKSGKPCRALAVKNGLCSLHANPGRAAELGRKSGRARRYVLPEGEQAGAQPTQPPRTAEDARDTVANAIADVRGRRLDPKVATAVGYLVTVFLKTLELSDLEQRLAKLEARHEVAGDPNPKS